MIKAVLFDLDGTLLNRDLSVREFICDQYHRFYRFLGHIPKEKYVSKFIELDCRGYVWKDKVYEQLVNEYNIHTITPEQLLEDYITQFKNSCVLYPNLIVMLEMLKDNNMKLGMITNGKGQFQMDNVAALGIENYFDAILISEWEGCKKPEPQIFEKALRKLNVSASESLFVGDHPDNDVKAAENAGMKGIWKKDEYWGKVEADYIINDLSEIPIILKEAGENGIRIAKNI
ncbi:2-haloalkanoic acid dehalogenase [Heyndrickxia sporothermodurans]|uniref:2-haloalkanoic acid dehalogenase n=1 Tax=Heyndrickxia sporothermodurans TaxID=46224 RepID=A0A150KN31_9BACI|nr:HAD family hydrolase [Heyndrickxia sporothermodurans]KYC99902.1 2-haloalkanoic acid dehalogenase [Heyndrickxia sporothermodurans]